VSSAAPLFEIATGIAFACVLYVGLLARASLNGIGGRLQALGILGIAGGAFCTYQGLDTRDETFLMSGAVVFTVAAVLIAIGMGIRARQARTEQT
jgi:hypothetical protein